MIYRIDRGFSLIELLFVIGIFAYLTSVVLGSVQLARDKAYYTKGKKEFTVIHEALQLYLNDHGNRYPADVNRGLPNGLETYLPAKEWPNAPWPGTVYDWDVWTDPGGGENIIQISIRFCPAGGALSTCKFPKESWADNFDVNSSLYYCLQGACRSHINEPITYPGLCVNCTK